MPKASKATPPPKKPAARSAPSKPEPAEKEPRASAKATPAKATTPAKAKAAKSQSAKTTPAKAKAARATPAKSQAAKATPAKATPAKKGTTAKATPAKKGTTNKATSARPQPARKVQEKGAPAKASGRAGSPAASAAPQSGGTIDRTASVEEAHSSTTKAVAAAAPVAPPDRLGHGPGPVKKATPVPSAGDAKFFEEQRTLLLEERVSYEHQAVALKAEADQLAAEMEPGDVQFDEESGEGDSIGMERERDLQLAGQARAAIEEIDRALTKIEAGTYGICERCGQPIPKARLKALPYAALCVACKSGGLSSRR